MARLTRIHDEANPDEQALAHIEQIEAELAEDDYGDWSDDELRELHDELALELEAVLPGRAHGYAPSHRPSAPTAAEPGSAKKLQVMAERVRRGESCFHPQDAPSVPRREII